MDARPNPPFGDVVTAMITPFDAEGSVDYGTFWRLARHLVSNGSEGILVTGTTGESPTLSNIEKIALYKAAVDAVGGRAKVIAGTGTYDTKESVELSEQAAEVGVDAVLAVTPYYSKPPQEGLFRHFSAIADAIDIPLVVYNIPGRTSRLIEVETLARLAEHPNIVATKDAVDDIEYTRRALDALPHDFAVYAGSDHMIKPIVEAGGVGVISVASHLVGPQIKRLIGAIKSGDPGQVGKLNDALMPLFEALFSEPNPIPVKAALDVLWDPVGVPRLPLVAASESTLELVETALEAAQAV